MFAPKVAKPQTKSAESPTSKLAPRRSTLVGHHGHDRVEQMGARGTGHEQEVAPGNVMPRGASWDFSKIPVFPPDQSNRPQAPSTSEGSQPKLAIGRIDDPLEHEADRVADQVMRMPAPLQTERNGSPAFPGEVPASMHEVLGAPGHPLDAAARTFFEPRFEHNFADVTIHDDAPAARSARDVGALAYSVGRHVVVDAASYHPASLAGQRLLAHELAHVVQQQAGPVVRRQAAQSAPTGLPDKVPSGTASRDDVLLALTAFLTRVQTEAGTRTLVVSAPVRQALQGLVQGDSVAWLRIDSFLSRKNLPPAPDEFARQAVAQLPPTIPRSRLDHLEQIPAIEAKDTRPMTLGTAMGAAFDAITVPLIKALPIPEDQRAKITDLARQAIIDGVFFALRQAMQNSQIDGKAQDAIVNSLGAGTREPTAGRKVEPTSPYVQPAPPSTVPSGAALTDQLRSVGVPGKSSMLPAPSPDIQLPSVDIPQQAGPKPGAPTPPTVGALDQAIQGLDRNSLIPPEARGLPVAAKFTDAQLFAREVGNALDAAARARRSTAELTLSGAYRDVQDTPALFDEVARIVRVVADALPHHAFQVGQVDVWIEDTMRHRVIPLHQSP